MAYTIKQTTTGPAIVLDSGEIYFVAQQDYQHLFDIADEDENFLDNLGNHIVNTLAALMQHYGEAFVDALALPVAEMIAYLNAGNSFKNMVFVYNQVKAQQNS